MTELHDIPVNTVATVDLGALRHNARHLMRIAPGVTVTGVVKADAYGHGAVRVSRVLLEEGVSRLAVATIAEGAALRTAGLNVPILVFAPPLDESGALYAEYELEAVVDSTDSIAALESAGAAIACHVEIDTGMTRVGVRSDQAAALIRRVESSNRLRLSGIMTHLADAESALSPVTDRQLDRLERILRQLNERAAPVHVANSAGLFADSRTAERLASMGVSGARAGIGLYGLLDVSAEHPLAASVDALRPVMELSTRILAVHTIDKGDPVSYGGTWTAPGTRRIATLGAGYADGYPRLCSNRAVVEFPDSGGTAPVAGRVCMDMTMVDLGPPDGPMGALGRGAKAVLFGADKPSCSDVARWAGTITYEITCGVSRRVPRRYVDSPAGA